MITTVLLDWGHTLFDTAGSVEFIESRSAALGSPISADEAAALHADALTRSRSAEELAKGRDLSLALHRVCWMSLWAPFETRCPGLAAELWEFETGPSGWRPYQDAPLMLTQLKALGLGVVIVSDVPFDLRQFFTHYGLDHLIDAYVLSSEHGVTKAEGGLFPIALAVARCEPNEALMVGDNAANDGNAVRYGIRTLLLPHFRSGTDRGLEAVVRVAAPAVAAAHAAPAAPTRRRGGR